MSCSTLINDYGDAFGDSLPDPPENTVHPDSSRQLGKMYYGIRKGLLRLFYPYPKLPLIPKPDQVKNLLVVQMERMGDLVLTEPTLRALRLLYLDANRTLVANSYAEELFAGSGWGDIKTADYLDSDELDKYDLVVDLTGRVEIKIAKKLMETGIQHRIGFDRGGRGVFQTVSIPWPDITQHMSQVYFKLAGALGAEENDLIPSLPHGPDRKERGEAIWGSFGLREPVILFPGAHYPEQRWSRDNFIKAGSLIKQEGIQLAIISGPGEEPLCDDIAASLDISHIKSPSITELMDLIATSKVMVVNNTGPLHLACSLGIATVSTMGPTIPWRWWPVSASPAVVFRGGSTSSEGNLELIDPIEVSTAVLALCDD